MHLSSLIPPKTMMRHSKRISRLNPTIRKFVCLFIFQANHQLTTNTHDLILSIKQVSQAIQGNQGTVPTNCNLKQDIEP